MDNKKQVEIFLRGVQEADNETDETVTATVGECIEKNGRHYIMFDENNEGHHIKNMIRIGSNDVEVTKTGDINSKMRFAPGEEFAFSYNTPYGAILMSVITKMMLIEKNSDVIKVHIRYDLYADHIHTAECKLDITVK